MNPSRRSVAKGVAWTLPVLTVAAAAPSVAASSTLPPVTLIGKADKCPGNSDVPGGWPKHGYRLEISGPTEVPVIEYVVLNNGDTPAVVAGPTMIAVNTWEWVLDAESSASKITVKLLGYNQIVVKAKPHCN